MSDVRDSEDVEGLAAPPTKTIGTAYLLWFVAGLFGAHRFYVARWISGTVYFAVTIMSVVATVVEPLALLALALVVDAFLIPRMVAARNTRLASVFAEHPERFAMLDRADIAPWARERRDGVLYALGTPFRILAFIVLPASVAFFAAWYGIYELAIFPLVILVATGLVGSLDQLVVRYPALQNVPALESALERVRELRSYYWNHEPRALGSMLTFFSRCFSEYRPYWKIIGILVAAVAIDTVFNFGDNYPPFLGWDDAALVFVFLAISVTFAVFLNLIPLTALAFHYSLSGKRRRLRVLTVVALAVTVAAFVGTWRAEKKDEDTPSLVSQLRLDVRMEKKDFRENLKRKLEAFLRYYMVFDTEDHKRELRESLAGIALNDETEAFGFRSGDAFVGVFFQPFSSDCNPDGVTPFMYLTLADRDGVVYHRWEDLPVPILEELDLPPECRKLIDDDAGVIDEEKFAEDPDSMAVEPRGD